MLKGYADEHVPDGLLQALRARGMDVVTVQERGRRSAADSDLLAEAPPDHPLLAHIRAADIDNLTPLSALALIRNWQEELGEKGTPG